MVAGPNAAPANPILRSMEEEMAEASPVSLPGERRVLERIYARCGGSILEAGALSRVPSEFLGALTANESAGAPGAARFEPAVFRHLQAVAAGQCAAYGSIRAADIDWEVEEALDADDRPGEQPQARSRADEFHARFLTAGFCENNRPAIAAFEDDHLRQLATSWGCTQIMGYHMIGRPGTVKDLLSLSFHYRLAVDLLAQFAADYSLDPGVECEELFRCWNTGRPYGKTYDPGYVENGMRRMRLYREIAQQPLRAT